MIQIDHRERKYNDPNNAVPKILEKMVVPSRKCHLDVGDYVIIGDKISACVELKNADDYTRSVLDGRLNDELLSMSSTYEYNVLLIIGSVSEAIIEDSNMRRETWFNYLAGCVTDISPMGYSSKISVINVEDEYDAAAFLSTLNKKISNKNIYREPTARKSKPPKGKEQLYSMMWMFPPSCHIGLKRAKSLFAHYRCIKDLCATTKKELEELDGIGPKIADGIIRHIGNLDNYTTVDDVKNTLF